MPILMRQCPRCGKEKPDSEFRIYSRGRRINCDTCDTEVYGPAQEEHTEDPRWMCYSDYILSDAWRERKRKKIVSVGCCCEECGIKYVVLHVHHLTYANLGNELDEDLQVLCERCHKSKHPGWT